MDFTLTDFGLCFFLGLIMGGTFFYPLAVLMLIRKGFKSF